MAKAFNLTAQINLQGPTNIKPVVASIRRQLSSINTNVNIKLDPKAIKGVDVISQKLQRLNQILLTTSQSSQNLNASLSTLGRSIQGLSSINKVNGSLAKTAKSVSSVTKATKQAASGMEEFGKQSALAIKRFAAFSVVTAGVLYLTESIRSGAKAFFEFDKQLIRLQQVTGAGAVGIKSLQDEITSLAINLGVSSESLTEVAVTLAQAGLSAKETQQAMAALAKTELAPSFDNMTETTEGAIAAMRQFSIQTQDLESALGSINAVAAAFAVESSDIITAIQRAGGAFAASSKGVSEGTDALNEFIAVFTSVRATTRESAETIATGLRTIFTRIQRGSTIKFLREFGVELTDVEGKFVGPYEAVKRLSSVLSSLDPRDLRFSQIVEELGGFRQISKVIPLIQQFAEAEKALAIAQKGQGSLSAAQATAQKSLANQVARVREEFLALIRAIGQSQTFQALFKIVLGLTSGLIKLANVFKPILPLLVVLGAVQGGKGIKKFGTGFLKTFSRGGGSAGGGSTTPSPSGPSGPSGGSSASSSAIELINNTKSLVANTASLDALTTSVKTLEQSIQNNKSTTLNAGGPVKKFARGGYVPGSGNRDTVPAMLTPGEFVIRKKAVETIGPGNLERMNRYADGGEVKLYLDYANTAPDAKREEEYIGKNLTKSVSSLAKTYNPESKNTGSARNISNYASIVGNIFQSALELAGKGSLRQDSDPNRPIDFPSGLPSNLNSAFNTAGKNFPTDAKKSDYNIVGKMTKKIQSSEQYAKGNKEFAAAIYETGQDRDFKIPIPELQKKSIGGLIQKFKNGGIGKKLGARSKIKELDESELAQLSTDQLIAYAKKQAFDIFSTGGAGMAVGSEFIEVPKERIVPELESDLVTYMGKKGFWREIVKPFGTPQKQSQKSISKIGREAALQAQIAKQSDEVAAREQQWTSIKSGSPIDNYLLQSLKDPILTDYKTSKEGGTLEKTFHATRLRQAVNKALEDYDNFDYSAKNLDTLISNFAAKKMAIGGLVQRFMAGGVATSGSLDESILERIKALGGPTRVKDLVPGAVAEAVKASGIRTSGKLLDSRSLKADPNSGRLAPFLEKVLSAAEDAKKGKETAARKQLENNMKAATGGAYQFGLVSIFGPNGELGYDSVSDAKELTGKNGEKFLTQIVRKSLPTRYADAIKQMQTDIAGVPSRAAERFQYTDIFGTNGPLAFDFDETLVKGADIYAPNGGIDIKAYNDLAKVKEALSNAELTLLGKELAKRLIDYPKLLDNIRVLTARPQSNAPLLASKLTQLGLPIPEDKITGVNGGLNKVTNLSELETLIDDNLGNIQSVIGGGKKGILYNEPKGIDPNDTSSRKSMAVMEGYALEEMIKSLGVRIAGDDDDPNRPIDYPKGLGASASKWGIKSTMPTDTKRTNDSSALGRIWAEAQRYFIEKFAFGGKVGESEFEKVKKEILDKYPEINFRITKSKRKRGYNLLGGLKQEGSNIGNYADFQQPSNLSQLQEMADKMASSLLYEYGPNIDPSLLKKKQKFAKGGSAQDTVPALLTPGEFVINKKAAQKIGYGKLHKMNKADKIQGFNKGGAVGGVQRFAVGGTPSPGNARALELFAIYAQQASVSLKNFEAQIKSQILDKALSNESSRKASRLDLRKEFTKTAIKYSPTDLRNVDIQDEIRTKLTESLSGLLDPSELNDAIDEIIYGLGTGAQSLEDIAKVSTEVAKALDTTIDRSEALSSAHKDLENELGALTDSVKSTAAEFDAFEYAKSGKATSDFGLLGKMNPGGALAFKNSARGSKLLNVAQNFQQTGGLGKLPLIGKGIGSLGKVLEDLPGPIGQAVKAVGGLPGALAVAASVIGSEFIPSLLKAVNASDSEIGAGIGGALAQGGSMAASVGALGNQIAGPIGGLVGTIGGAVAGAIKGFSDSIRTKALENALKNLTAQTEKVDKAFEFLAKNQNTENIIRAQKETVALQDSIDKLGSMTEPSIGQRAAAGASTGTLAAVGTFLAGLGLVIGGTALGATGVAGTVGTAGAAAPLGAAGVAAGGYMVTAGGTMMMGAPAAGVVAGGAQAALMGPDDLNDEALQGQLKAISTYIEGLNKLAEIEIKKLSLNQLDEITANIDKINKDLQSGKLNPQQADQLKKQENIRLGQQSKVIEQAQRGALARANRFIDPNKNLADQIAGDQDAQRISNAAADTAAYNLALEELSRKYDATSEAGRQQIRKESKDKQALIERGYELAGSNEYQAAVAQRLALLTKEMSKETESLVAAYTRALAGIGRFKDELNNLVNKIEENSAMLTGEGGMGRADRTQQEMLQNMTAYTAKELEPVLQNVAGLAGGGEQGQKLTDSLRAGKILQEKLPEILRTAGARNVNEVISTLDQTLSNAGIGDSVRTTLVKEVEKYLGEETANRSGDSFQDVLANFPALADAIDTTKKAQEVGVAILEAQNDALDAVNQQLDQYNKYLKQSLQWSIKADQIRLQGAIDLDRALGRSVSLDRLNAPFENEIRSLTSEIMGGIGTTDPVAIAEGIRANQRRDAELRGNGTDRGLIQQSLQDLTPEGKEKTKALLDEQARLARSSQNAYEALEKLATSGDIAANILGKIEEERQQGKNVIEFVRQVSTQSAEEAVNMQRSFKAFNLALNGGLNLGNRENRQLAYQGMDTLLPLLKGSETGNKIISRFTKQMLVGQGVDINKPNVFGSGKTLSELIDAGTTGTDPGTERLIKLYEQSLDQQETAARELSKLNGERARKHLEGTETILNNLYNNLPMIIASALVNPERAAAGKAEVPAMQPANNLPAVPIAADQPIPVVVQNAQNNNGPVVGANVAGNVNAQNLNAAATVLPQVDLATLNKLNNNLLKLSGNVLELSNKLANGTDLNQSMVLFNNSTIVFGEKIEIYRDATIAFGNYVDNLSTAAAQLSNAKITMGGNYTVDVKVSGAAAFQAIEEGTQKLIDKEIGLAMKDMVDKIKKATGMSIDLNRREP